MPLEDPVAVHNSSTNAEAYLIRNVLTEAGIEAHVMEYNPHVGTWGWFGQLAELNSPKVMIERRDMDRAGPILADYEQRHLERVRAEEEQKDALGSVEAVCEDCGEKTTFVAGLRGTIQDCPKCGAFLDVGEVAADEIDFEEAEEELDKE